MNTQTISNAFQAINWPKVRRVSWALAALIWAILLSGLLLIAKLVITIMEEKTGSEKDDKSSEENHLNPNYYRSKGYSDEQIESMFGTHVP